MDSVIYGWLLGRAEWRKFREDVFKARGRCCEMDGCCETENLDVHHVVYRKGSWPWDYSVDDMRVYCHAHHMELHRTMKNNGEEPKTEDGNVQKYSDGLCPRCGGTGFLPEFHDLVGGKCLQCLGYTRVLPERLSLKVCEVVAREFWADWKEKRPQNDWFKSLWNVFDWVGGMQGYTEEEMKQYGADLVVEEC